jgi:(1->4)-alpha-D-glucan 1-alpha-D-glucosylmutase
MIKAVREAKVHSSWINPNADYEAATGDFVRALLAPEPNNLFVRDFVPFQQRVARVGAFTSLAQLLLRLASPGVPDLYQGSELWDFSLADPDNRRPVDYAQRQAALQSIRAACAERGPAACADELLDRLQDGQIKLYLTWKTLALRRECEPLFREGDYLPLKTHGARAEQLCAFARHAAGETLVVLVPRLFGSLMAGDGRLPVADAVWGDTWVELPPERMHAQWVNVLSGQTVDAQPMREAHGLLLAQVFERFPYALLRAHESHSPT